MYPYSHFSLPVLRSMFARLFGASGFGAACAASALAVKSSFSESLPPELSIDTSVSIPIWSQPSTDFDLVANCFERLATFTGWGGGGLRDSISSINSSGESSSSSLSLFSVKLTLIEKNLLVKSEAMLIMNGFNGSWEWKWLPIIFFSKFVVTWWPSSS